MSLGNAFEKVRLEYLTFPAFDKKDFPNYSKILPFLIKKTFAWIQSILDFSFSKQIGQETAPNSLSNKTQVDQSGFNKMTHKVENWKDQLHRRARLVIDFDWTKLVNG